jgi:hypothetical protein
VPNAGNAGDFDVPVSSPDVAIYAINIFAMSGDVTLTKNIEVFSFTNYIDGLLSLLSIRKNLNRDIALSSEFGLLGSYDQGDARHRDSRKPLKCVGVYDGVFAWDEGTSQCKDSGLYGSSPAVLPFGEAAPFGRIIANQVPFTERKARCTIRTV